MQGRLTFSTSRAHDWPIQGNRIGPDPGVRTGLKDARVVSRCFS